MKCSSVFMLAAIVLAAVLCAGCSGGQTDSPDSPGEPAATSFTTPVITFAPNIPKASQMVGYYISFVDAGEYDKALALCVDEGNLQPFNYEGFQAKKQVLIDTYGASGELITVTNKRVEAIPGTQEWFYYRVTLQTAERGTVVVEPIVRPYGGNTSDLRMPFFTF